MVSALRRLVCCGGLQLSNRLEGPGQDRGGSASSRTKITEDVPSAFSSGVAPMVDDGANLHTQAQDAKEVEVINSGARLEVPQARLRGHATPYISQQSLSAPTSPCRGMGPRSRPGAPVSAAPAAGPMAQLEEELRLSETSPFRNTDGWSTALERSDDVAAEYPASSLSPPPAVAGNYLVQGVRPVMAPGNDMQLSSSLSEPVHSSPETDSQQPTGASTFAALHALAPPQGFRHRSTASIRVPSTSSAATFATAPSALPSGASVLASGISTLAAAPSLTPTPTASQPLPSPPPSTILTTTANVVPLPPPPPPTVVAIATAAAMALAGTYPAGPSPPPGANVANVPFRPPPAPPTTGHATTDMVAAPLHANPLPAPLHERKQPQRRSAPGASRLALSARYKSNEAYGSGGGSTATRGITLAASRLSDGAARDVPRPRPSRTTRLPTTSDAGNSERYSATTSGVPVTPAPRVSGLGMLSGFTRRLLQMVQEGMGSVASFHRTSPTSSTSMGPATAVATPAAPALDAQIPTSALAFVMSPSTTQLPNATDCPQSEIPPGGGLTSESGASSGGGGGGGPQGCRSVIGHQELSFRLAAAASGGGGGGRTGGPAATGNVGSTSAAAATEDLRGRSRVKSGSTGLIAQRNTVPAAEQSRDDGEGANGGGGCTDGPPLPVSRPRPRRVVGPVPPSPGPAGSYDSWVAHLEAAEINVAEAEAGELSLQQQRGGGGLHEEKLPMHVPAYSQPLPMLRIALSQQGQQQQQQQQQEPQQSSARLLHLQPGAWIQPQQGTSTTTPTMTPRQQQQQQRQQPQQLLQLLQPQQIEQLQQQQQQRAMSQPLPRPSSALQNWAAQQQLYQQQLLQQAAVGQAPHPQHPEEQHPHPQPTPQCQSLMAQARPLSHNQGSPLHHQHRQQPARPHPPHQQQHNHCYQHTVGEFYVKRDLGGPRVIGQERTRSEADWGDVAATVMAASTAADMRPVGVPRVTSCNGGLHGLGTFQVGQARAPVVPSSSTAAAAPGAVTAASAGVGVGGMAPAAAHHHGQGQVRGLHAAGGALMAPGSPRIAYPGAGGGGGGMTAAASAAAGSVYGGEPATSAAGAGAASLVAMPLPGGALRPAAAPGPGGSGVVAPPPPGPVSTGPWPPVVGSRPAVAGAAAGAGAGTGTATSGTLGGGGGGDPAGAGSSADNATGGRWLFDAAQQQLVPTGPVAAGRMSRVVNPEVSQVALMQLLHFGSLSGRVPLAHLATLNVARLSREIRALHWIGQGGGGAVFQGVWQGAPVAVKFMLAARPEHVDATALEAIVSLTVGHPNVVTTYSFDVTRLTEGSFSDPEWGGPGGHMTMGALHNTDDSSATALYNVLMDTTASLDPVVGGGPGEGGAGAAPSTSRTRRALQSTTSASGLRFRAAGGGGGGGGGVSGAAATACGSGASGGGGTGGGGAGGGGHAGGAVSRGGAGRVERLESLNMRVRRAQAAAVAASHTLPEELGAANQSEGGGGSATATVGGGGGAEVSTTSGGGAGGSAQQQHPDQAGYTSCTRGGAAAATAVQEAPFGLESLFNSEEGFGEPDLASNSQSWTVRHVLSYLKARPGMYMTHIIMEYCDRGSLQSAIKRGVFRLDGAVPDIPAASTPSSQAGGVAGAGASGGGCSSAGGVGTGEGAVLNPFPRRVVLRALLRTARDVAQGMSHLHANGIIHGDLKPGNVLLRGCRTDRRGFTALVSDFGLSKITRGDKPLELNHWSTVTVMAPEVIMGRWLKASDVFSFGILLWQLVAGDMMPYGTCTVRQVLIGVAKGTLKPEWPAYAHPALVRLGRACLATSPEQRPSFPAIVKILTKIEQHVRNELRPARPPTAAAATHYEAAGGGTGLGGEDAGQEEGEEEDRGSFGEEGQSVRGSRGSGSLHRRQQQRQSDAAPCHLNRFRSSYR